MWCDMSPSDESRHVAASSIKSFSSRMSTGSTNTRGFCPSSAICGLEATGETPDGVRSISSTRAVLAAAGVTSECDVTPIGSSACTPAMLCHVSPADARDTEALNVGV